MQHGVTVEPKLSQVLYEGNWPMIVPDSYNVGCTAVTACHGCAFSAGSRYCNALSMLHVVRVGGVFTHSNWALSATSNPS